MSSSWFCVLFLIKLVATSPVPTPGLKHGAMEYKGPVFLVKETVDEKEPFVSLIVDGGIEVVKPVIGSPITANPLARTPPPEPSPAGTGTLVSPGLQQTELESQEDPEYFAVLVTPETVAHSQISRTTTITVPLTMLLIGVSAKIPWLLVLRKENHFEYFKTLQALQMKSPQRRRSRQVFEELRGGRFSSEVLNSDIDLLFMKSDDIATNFKSDATNFKSDDVVSFKSDSFFNVKPENEASNVKSEDGTTVKSDDNITPQPDENLNVKLEDKIYVKPDDDAIANYDRNPEVISDGNLDVKFEENLRTKPDDNINVKSDNKPYLISDENLNVKPEEKFDTKFDENLNVTHADDKINVTPIDNLNAKSDDNVNVKSNEQSDDNVNVKSNEKSDDTRNVNSKEDFVTKSDHSVASNNSEVNNVNEKTDDTINVKSNDDLIYYVKSGDQIDHVKLNENAGTILKPDDTIILKSDENIDVKSDDKIEATVSDVCADVGNFILGKKTVSENANNPSKDFQKSQNANEDISSEQRGDFAGTANDKKVFDSLSEKFDVSPEAEKLFS